MRDRRQEWETIMSLHGLKRLQHIWIYYRARIFVTIFAVFTVATFAHMLWEGQRPCRLRVCVMLETGESCEEWFDAFAEELKQDGKPGDVDLSEDRLFKYDDPYSSVMAAEIMATISSQRMDVAICGEDLYSYLLSLNACMDMDDVWGEEEKGNMIFVTSEAGAAETGAGVKGEFALDLTGSAFAEKYNGGKDGGPLYGVLISNTEHLEDARALLESILSLN